MLDNDPTTTDNNEEEGVAPVSGAPDTPSESPADAQAGSASGASAQGSADTPGNDTVLAEQKPARKTAAKKTAKAPAKKAAAKKAVARKAAKPVAGEPDADAPIEARSDTPVDGVLDSSLDGDAAAPVEKPKKKAAARKRTAKRVANPETSPETSPETNPETGPKTGPKTGPEAISERAGDAPLTGLEIGSTTSDASAASPTAAPAVLFQAPEATTTPPRKRTTRKVSAAPRAPAEDAVDDTEVAAVPKLDADTQDSSAGDSSTADSSTETGDDRSQRGGRGRGGQGGGQGGGRGQGGRSGQRGKASALGDTGDTGDEPPEADDQDDSDDDSNEGEGGARRRRRRGGRRRRKPSDEESDNLGDSSDDSEGSEGSEDSATGSDAGRETDQARSGDSDSDSRGDSGDDESPGTRRRRRRRRTGDDGDGSGDDSGNGGGGQRARKQRNPEDEITSIGGSTRLEAKKQRRREGREAGRRRAPIVSEAEFLARRESVDRVMVIRQKEDLTQIGVLEDKVLVEHYVARESQTSLIGNVYLGRVQNVLPSMEAAFIDIGKGRNAVLYAGEVNWTAVGHKDGQQRKIESVLSSGQTILVQVSKDPVGHKGARLTGQVSLPGRFLVYVPDGNTSGISRKLPDTERNRLKTLLKKIVPESAGVIVRTAAEGASEEELTLDVERLTARWADIEEKVKAGKSPQMLYGEPDLTLKVVRDLFTEDFGKLVVQGDDAWDLVSNYVSHVAPDLQERLERFEPSDNNVDLFATYRVDEQIAKGLDRKVWLPSGGSLVIDRTEAMTVVDVNTGKFTGSGGNLEETVTKNNLEAAEEMVRQLRLRDIGGIIVIDFIDMVLESNRDLVLRRLVECLGRDRTRHQVAEVTSLGLVQMTRKRIGTGLVEAFSTDCTACKGRGLVVHEHPVEAGTGPDDDDSRGRGRGRGGRNRGGSRGNDGGGNTNVGGSNGGANGNGGSGSGGGAAAKPSPADLAKIRPPEKQDDETSSSNDADRDQVRSEVAPEVGHEPEPLVEQAVIGRPTGISPEPQAVPSESVATEVAPVLPDAVETTTVEPAEPPVAPRVVTSTRRRTARRPAGPPVAMHEAAPSSGAGRESSPSAEPVDIPVEPAASGHAAEVLPQDSAPAVDPTSTGEPVAEPDPRAEDQTEPGVNADPTWPTDQSDTGNDDDADNGPDSAEDGTEDDSEDGTEEGEEDTGNGFALSHVPVKRKGSRKR